VYYVPSGAFR